MISFLNPWFWLGLAALSAPLWLHLRRKPETNLHLFSTLCFLDDCPRPQQNPRRLQQLLLLALRILGLLLLIAAFAWPYLPAPDRAPIQESRVYVLDNTLSRQADPTWSLHRDRIVQELQQLKPTTQAAVILLGNQPQVLLALGDDPTPALDQLRDLKPSFQRGSYLAALRQAKTLLDHSLGARKHIVLLTDNQNNQWAEHVQSPPFLNGIELTSPTNPQTNAANLALSEPQATRIYLGDRSVVNFTVRLDHDTSATEAAVSLKANQQIIFDRSLDLIGAPDTLMLSAQWEADPHTWLEGEVIANAQPDSLASDNRVYFAVPPVREGRVAVLAQSDYLRLALSPEVMRGHWQTRFLDPNDLTATDQGEEVLILESSYLQSAEVRRLVSSYLSNRRGVFLLLNRLTPAVQGALRELGFAPLSSEALLAPAQKPFRFQYLQGRHPILNPFLVGDYGKLLEVEVQQHYSIDAVDAYPLIISDTGQGLLFQGTRFPGTLLVLSFALDRAQTSWPVHPTFIPFLDLCLHNARPREPNELEYQPGEVALLNFPKTTTALLLTGPDGSTTNVMVADGRLRLPVPDQPGLYRLQVPGEKQPEKIIAINPSPKESYLRYNNQPEALELWRAGPAPAEPVPISPLLAERPSLRGILSQSIWWWLLVVGLVILLLEQIWTVAAPKAGTAA